MRREAILDIIHTIVGISALTLLIVGLVLESYQVLFACLGMSIVGFVMAKAREK